MSYRGRLSLSIVALILALVAGLSVAYLRYLVGIQLQIALGQAENVADQLQSMALEGVAEGKWPALLERWLGGAPNIAEIAVTDQAGRVLGGTSPARQQWINLPRLGELAGSDFLAQWRAIYAPRQEYEVTREVAAGEQKILTIHVAVSTALLLRGELDRPIRKLAWLAGFGLLASLALAVVFSRVVFRPLDRLGEAIDRMTRGEFAPAALENKPARDEYTAISSKLSVLGQQFSSLRGNMEQLLQRLDGAVLLFDADDLLIIASAAAERFLGLGRWQIMGLKLDDVFPAGTELGALVSSAARLRQPIVEKLVEAGPGGAIRRVLVSVELIDDFANRRRRGLLVTLRDADTRRQIETQMEVSSRLAAISRLTGGVAHEIKNPLNAMSLHLALLQDRLAREGFEPGPELGVIGREMARLDRVVKTFLDFARPVELKLAAVRVAGLVEEVAALAAPDALGRRVRVEVENGCPEALVRADRDLLKQAVLNLALNGIQSMPEGGELKLGVSRTGAELELAVADQGTGILPENREKIFRLYFTTRKEGSGMGLAMTFRVVQLHNGTIDFVSEPGKGTTFRVRLPALEGA